MKNVYIDLGCYTGDTVEQFRNWSKIAWPDRKSWHIYAFDPNPSFKDRWEVVADERTTFSQKAAWIDEDGQEFAIEEGDTPLGSTIMPGKKKIWDNSEKILVETFDLSKWLKQFKHDYVVLKMDIEGAEFPILKKMIKDETDQIVDCLMVEFHPNKVVEYTTTDKITLFQQLQSRGVDIKDWH